MIRVVGSTFSFYSISPSDQLMEIFGDYKKLDRSGMKEMPRTTVYKCAIPREFPDADGVAPRPSVQFSLPHPVDRHLIIHMLDRIRLAIIGPAPARSPESHPAAAAAAADYIAQFAVSLPAANRNQPDSLPK